MRRLTFAAALVFSVALPAAAETERWLHLRVQEENGSRTRVEINLPHSVLAVAVPLIPDLEPDDVHICIQDAKLSPADLYELVRAAEASPELKPISVAYEDGTMTAFRRGAVLVIQISSSFDPDERSEIQLPLRVAQALVQRGDGVLDLRAAALELSRVGEGQLLFAADDDTIVRLWVDHVPAGVRRSR